MSRIMPPASTAPSWAVSPVRMARAPAARTTARTAARSSVETWLASSTTTTSWGVRRMAPRDPPSSRRPRNWATLTACVMPSAAMTRAAFVDSVTPTARPPVHWVQARANAAMVWVLPEPAGATRTDTAVRAARSPAATSAWAGSRSDSASASSAWAGVTSWGTSRAASRDQILLQVQVGRGGVPLRARRGVHAAAVRRAEPECGHVHHVRGRAEGQHRARGHRLGRQLLGQGGLVHPGSHGRHGPVDLPQERGPGERRGRALGGVHRAADDAPALLRRQHLGPFQALRRGKRPHCYVHSRQGVHLTLGGPRLPGVQLLPGAALRHAATVRPAVLLGLPAGQRGVLGHGPQRPLGRLPAVPLAVLLRHPPHLGRDLRPAAGEGVHDLLGHPAHLEAVPIRAGHQHIAQAGQTRGQLPGGHGRHGQALLIQEGTVEGPPAGVRAVRPLGQVEHRVMDVELRIPLPGGVLEKRRDNAPGRVAVLPRGGRVVPGPDVQRALCSRQRRACCGLQRLGDRPGVALQLPGLGVTPAGAGLACCDQQRSVQHRHRLGRAHGEVKVRDRMLGLGPLGRPDQLQIPVRGERVRGLMGGHRRVHALLRGPVLGPLARVQALAIRPHAVHVERLEDGRVHLAPEAELGRRPAAPPTGRLPGRLRVVLRPARVPGGLALGQVARIVALGQRGDASH